MLACMHTYIHTYIHTLMHTYINTFIHCMIKSITGLRERKRQTENFLRCYRRNSVKIIEKYAASGVITAVKSL